MKILDDLISILNPEAGVKDIRQGVFHAGVLTLSCGLAALDSKRKREDTYDYKH